MFQQAPLRAQTKVFGLAALGLMESGLLVGGSTGDSTTQLVITCMVALLGGLTLLWIFLDDELDATGYGVILLLALLVRLVALMGMPILEDDHFRYLWDGMRTATTFQPYDLPPSAFFGDPSWDDEWQEILSGVNNPDIPSIYGPTLQYLFAAGYWLSPAHILAIQALLVGVDMSTIALLLCTHIPARYVLAYALHPLILSQAIVSAHPDGLLGLLALAAMLAWHRDRIFFAGALLGLALGTKVSAALLLPFFCWPCKTTNTDKHAHKVHHVLRLMLGTTLSLAGLYLPFWLNKGSESQALQTFATQWQFNPLVFRLLLSVGLNEHSARWLAISMVGVMLIGLIKHWRHSFGQHHSAMWPPVDLAFAALLIVSPVVNPWYWLWGLAPGLLRLQRWGLAFGACAFVSYFNSTVLFEAGWSATGNAAFAVPWLVTALEMTLLSALFLYDRNLRKTAHQLESP